FNDIPGLIKVKSHKNVSLLKFTVREPYNIYRFSHTVANTLFTGRHIPVIVYQANPFITPYQPAYPALAGNTSHGITGRGCTSPAGSDQAADLYIARYTSRCVTIGDVPSIVKSFQTAYISITGNTSRSKAGQNGSLICSHQTAYTEMPPDIHIHQSYTGKIGRAHV